MDWAQIVAQALKPTISNLMAELVKAEPEQIEGILKEWGIDKGQLKAVYCNLKAYLDL